MHSNGILYLINPKANDDSAKKNWKKIQLRFTELPENPIDITKVPDLPSLIRKESPKFIVIAGGDGTVNFVVNAVLHLEKKPLLSIFPLGLGNALSYCLGVETAQKAFEVLTKRPSSLAIDVIKTNIKTYPIGVFNISVGFDARIVHTRSNYKYIGFWSYIISVLRLIKQQRLEPPYRGLLSQTALS